MSVNNISYQSSISIFETSKVVNSSTPSGSDIVPNNLISTSGGITFPSASSIWNAQSNPQSGMVFTIANFNVTSGNINFGTGVTVDPDISVSFSELTLGTGSRNIWRIKLISNSVVYANRISTN